MIRNLSVIVVLNVVLLFCNLHLLNWSVRQPDSTNPHPRDGFVDSQGSSVVSHSRGTENHATEEHGSQHPHSPPFGKLQVTSGSPTSSPAGSLQKLQPSRSAKATDSRTTGNKSTSILVSSNRPAPEIYRTVFYNATNALKQSPHRVWTTLRKGYKIPQLPFVKKIDCQALLSGQKDVVEQAKQIMNQREHTKVPIYEEMYLEWTQDCDSFKLQRGYVTVPLTLEEERFPIAFSIAMFTDVEQMERLLRAVYQPQNLYCIHVDVKSSLLIHKTVAAIASCFDNVFLASQITKVKWGDISVLLPHLYCMRDLVLHHRGKWKYFIDLAGQEFPLRTNYEIVQILKIFNGSNDLTASHKRMEQDRVRFQWAYRWSRTYQQTIFYNTFRKKEAPPLNVTVLKGELHGLFSRRFVEFIVESDAARRYLRWCWDTGHPSEHYWNTLNYNVHLQAPGGYRGDLESAELYSTQPVARVKHWQDVNYVPRECQGKLVRGICVFGVGDASWLATRREVIANKFHLTFEHFALDCMEERHRNRTVNYVGSVSPDFDTEFYRSVPTVRHSRKDGL